MSEKYEKAAEKNDNTDAQQQSTIKKGVLYMKTIVTLLILFTLFSLNTFAQDYTQLNLPEGAKVRLGKGWIYDIAYSPDGRTLASGTDDDTIRLRDGVTGAHIRTLTGHTNRVRSVIVQSGRSYACQWEWGRYYPSMGRCNGSAHTDADRSYGLGL